jgi:anthranilate phosphoribosyltransferase
VENGQVTSAVLDPQAFGLTQAPLSALQGGDLEDNVAILTAVLQGKGTPAQRDVVALNAALALKVGERVTGNSLAEEMSQGIALAQDILASGSAWDKLQALVSYLG